MASSDVNHRRSVRVNGFAQRMTGGVAMVCGTGNMGGSFVARCVYYLAYYLFHHLVSLIYSGCDGTEVVIVWNK